jgi:hypothetical protein
VLQKAEATVFHRFMRSGRTSPAIFGCTPGNRDEEADYVVKLRGGIEEGAAGLVCEVVAAELADYFGIGHPEAAIIGLDDELANLVAAQEPDKAELVRRSIGMNFGTKLLSSLVIWPVDRNPSASQLEAAAEVFAFDALIQNPDRRFSNPNVGTVGERVFIFDHELAFSFRRDIFRDNEPWKVSRLRFWPEHVFFNVLRRRALPIEGFMERLAAFPTNMIDQIGEQIPTAWGRDLIHTIKDHLSLVSANAEEFREELLRSLT